MKRHHWLAVSILPAVLFAASAPVCPQGFILPFAENAPTPDLIQQNSTIVVHDERAEVQVRQVFQNPFDRSIEGFYLYPLPADAVPGSAQLKIKGKHFQGQVLGQSAADDVYLERFRATGSRSFLMMIQSRAYKARAYPFFAGQKLELRFGFSMKLLRDASGRLRLSYPLYASDALQQNAAVRQLPRYSFASVITGPSRPVGPGTDKSSTQTNDFVIEISSQSEIGGIYSTTHNIKIDRLGTHSARIYPEMADPMVDSEFVLYYGSRQKDIDVNLLSHRLPGELDGYFVTTISPDWQVSERRAVPKDVVFVLDLSNAMQTRQIRRAKEAFEYCISNLNVRDRFNIITFDTNVRLFRKELVPASRCREDGLAFLNDLRRSGGANLHSAILTALSLRGRPERGARTIILLTAGAHTVGVTDDSQIAADIAALNTGGDQIYTFNLGAPSDRLLTHVSTVSGGFEHHVSSTENITAAVSGFYDSIDLPILTSPEMTFSGVEVYDVYPTRRLPSLFVGEQLQIAGRFKGSGRLTATLSGTMLAGDRQFSRTFQVGGKSYQDCAALHALWARMMLYANTSESDDVEQRQRVRQIRDKVFYSTAEGGWLESGLSSDSLQDHRWQHIVYGGAQFYEYARANPGAAAYLAIGPEVAFQFDHSFIEIDEHISAEDRTIPNDKSEPE